MIGAIAVRRRGAPIDWFLGAAYVAGAAAASVLLSGAHGLLVTVARGFNGGNLGVALYAIVRSRTGTRAHG